MNWSLLLGFVGGLAAVALKGVVDFYFESRREGRTSRTAARLIEAEFANAEIYTEMVTEADRWEEQDAFAFDDAVWHEHKSQLAAELTLDDWRAVFRARWGVQQLTLYLRDARQESGEARPPLDRYTKQLVESIGENCRKARAVLDALARD